MAKYTVSHSCGHTSVQNLVGAEKDRSSKIAWFGRTLCSACYKAEQDAKRAAATQAAVDATSELPALTGSEKQIVWATTIRAEAVNAVDAKYAAMVAAHGADAQGADEVRSAIAALKAKTDSKFWIDNRNFGKAYSYWLRSVRG